jgi:hypothetical protein
MLLPSFDAPMRDAVTRWSVCVCVCVHPRAVADTSREKHFVSVPVSQYHSRVAKPIAQLLCQLSYLALYSGNNCNCYGLLDGVTC